ncbi:hypothetical protein CHS0354_018329 [Potamilus streckersoni]|uniref:Ion transport domain-containing protein n=1 Tax=Potamilus streckersoni TaxID=2493646 RepID=A0AAE0VGQ3_9BIVA|nr:hypothetical protein CHS0354_018329 [Potamilus streckersoni]
MGNTTVVASGVKNQADNASKTLYQLVDLKGGGELVELMKRARWTKNYTELDAKILTEVPKFVYNGGKGKRIPIVDLVMARNKDRQKSKIKFGKDKQSKAKELAKIDMNLTDAEGSYLHNRPERKFREVCWDISQTGTVGESILHLCLLNASAVHADLAKRLLLYFPKLINDIYISEEYYGENVLHMAIVNEDPAMVKFLLDKGADYHCRCCGKFFCPDDQKESRMDNQDHEWVDLCEKTNYEGYVYFGEYPLSFAACLGQEECVRLLRAKGANPNLQDANGNTVLHMLVIHDRKEMFDLLLSLGADLNIKNRQGLTPLTLAAKLARKDMYEYILEKIRQVYWIYGNVTSAGYPLQDIDTITATGEIHENSALNLIVYGDHDSHLSMMDGLVVNLLQEKWKTFARYRFYRRFIIFIVYFMIFVAAFVLRPGEDECPIIKEMNTSNGLTENVTEVDSCYLMKVCQQEDIARFVLEGLILFGASTYLFLAMKEIYHQGFKIFFTTLKGAPGKATFLLSCVFVVMMLPGRAACAYVYEDIVGVLAILTTAPYFLFFCRGFRIIGPFVVMIYKMIKGDLLRFCIIYLVFIIGFSQAFYIAFIDCTCERGLPCVFTNGAEGILGVFAMSVGQFEDIYATFGSSRYPELIRVVFVVYMIMVTLLLVNMLIAMMGNTYQLVNETQKEWFRQWAKIVLVVEQSVTTLERQKYQMAYSQPTNDKRRAFVIRWHQSENEKEELRKAREEQRRKQKEKVTKNRWQKVGKTALFTNTINLEAAKTGRLNI